MRDLRAVVVRARRRCDGAHRCLLRRIVDAVSGQRRRSRLRKSGLPIRITLDADRSVDHRHRGGVVVRRHTWIGRLCPQFVDLPQSLIVVLVVVALGAVAAWGILESVLLASVFTLIEVGGLLAIIAAAVHVELPIVLRCSRRRSRSARYPVIAFASLLAFFAFVGFEDLANVVEEAKVPNRDIPRAMVLTLLISTILYVAIAAIAISAVSVERLASSPAPLSLVFREVAGISPTTINAIAIVATLNTILAQMTMAARVIYGMARQGDLPGIVGRVHPRTATPLFATASRRGIGNCLWRWPFRSSGWRREPRWQRSWCSHWSIWHCCDFVIGAYIRTARM